MSVGAIKDQKKAEAQPAIYKDEKKGESLKGQLNLIEAELSIVSKAATAIRNLADPVRKTIAEQQAIVDEYERRAKTIEQAGASCRAKRKDLIKQIRANCNHTWKHYSASCGEDEVTGQECTICWLDTRG